METLPYILRAMLLYRKLTGSGEYEKDRQKLFGYMVSHLGKSEHGRGVGHQFDWYTTGLIPAYTPCVTLTSYLVDFIIEARKESAMPESEKSVLRDIGGFVFNDLNRQEHSGGAATISYTPLDKRRVINANSYAARIMYRLGKFFKKEDYTVLSKKLLDYVLKEQNEDGSWFYFEKGSVAEKENFIDSFHSAFILENLFEWATVEKDEGASTALEKGKDYFLRSFVNSDGSVNHFSKSHLPIKIKADIRSMAQSINCLALLSQKDPGLLETAQKIYKKTIETMYDGGGSFYFRKYSFYFSKMNYIRWGAAPMLNALCTLALAEKDRKEGS
ncbi:MAG: hypothetical protein V3S46_05540, partial [Nitrospinota bacterium]